MLEQWGGIEVSSDDWRFTVEAVAAAMVAHNLGDAAFASELYGRLLPRRGQLANSGDLNCEGPVDTYLGLLALTFDDPDLARGHLIDAVALTQRVASPVFEAQARLHLAEVLDGDERRRQLERSLLLADELGMARIAQQAREALAAGGADVAAP
jgi:hypothetical protein